MKSKERKRCTKSSDSEFGQERGTITEKKKAWKTLTVLQYADSI